MISLIRYCIGVGCVLTLFRASLADRGEHVVSAAFSKDGKLFATAGRSGDVTLWDAAGRAVVGAWKIDVGARSVAFHPGGGAIAVGCGDGAVRVLDRADGRWTVYKGQLVRINAVVYSPDGGLLASADADGVVWVRDAATGAFIRMLRGHEKDVAAVAFTPDGRTLISGSLDGTIRLWNSADGKLRKVLRGHRGGVWTLALSPDGKTLASAGGEAIVRLWDLAKGEELEPLRGHGNFVYSLSFSADGKTLASSSVALEEPNVETLAARGQTKRIPFHRDGEVLFWDVAQRKPVSLFDEPAGRVTALAFALDGKSIVVGSRNRTVRVVDVVIPTPLP